MVRDVDSCQSTLGFLITFASEVVVCQSRLQKHVALSTTETEFIAATRPSKESFMDEKLYKH